jgi:ABC-2 type transport system permease protein
MDARAILLVARVAQLFRGWGIIMDSLQPSVIAPSETAAGQSRSAIRYWRAYRALVKNCVVREMNFKANFVFWLFVEFLWFALQLTFNHVIYMHTESIGTWTKWEVVMLIGTSHFIQQLFQALFLVNCSVLSDLVHSGKFDFVLLFPINTRFLVSCRQVDLGGFISAASGLAVVIYTAHKLQLTPSFAQVLGYGLLSIAAILIHYSFMFLMATISFWTVRAQGLMMSYYNLFSITRIPDIVFGGASKALFTLAIPLLLIANVPVKLLCNTLTSPAELALMFMMALSCFLISKLVWSCGLRRYTSASS